MVLNNSGMLRASLFIVCFSEAANVLWLKEPAGGLNRPAAMWVTFKLNNAFLW